MFVEFTDRLLGTKVAFNPDAIDAIKPGIDGTHIFIRDDEYYVMQPYQIVLAALEEAIGVARAEETD